MRLVIVESPTKAKTISRFLGDNFRVESSFGHVRDLPSYKLGVDVKENFEPQYVIPRKAQANVKKLKELAKNADDLILATDEDREGEAIAWHLVQALGLNSKEQIANSKSSNDKRLAISALPIQRIVFHEITKHAIEEALNNPRDINLNLVDAQQTRRILDRLVGYKLSPFLWKKIMRGLSAGRVQSVAVRLIVERERAIRAFAPQAYWTIEALFQKSGPKSENSRDSAKFEAVLFEVDGQAIEKPGLNDENEVNRIETALKSADFKVSKIEQKTETRLPKPPFTTSTLQQDAWSRLKFSAKKTMLIAQQLYEGIDIKDEGQTGLITYMRTDSVNLSEESLKNAKKFIDDQYGVRYSLSEPRRFKTKSKSAQEAHEAIRPSNIVITPASVKNDLTYDQYRLYDLIWRRFGATQMAAAQFAQTSVSVLAVPENSPGRFVFKANGSIIKFDGFLKIYPKSVEEIMLPVMKEGDKLSTENLESIKHFTQPPPRYTEASLIKALEKFGIGRPSTYAPTMSVIQERGYVAKNETKQLVPSEIGEKVNDMLVENFPKIVDIDFTAHMEEELDQVAEGSKIGKEVLAEFYKPFEKNLSEKYESVEREDMTEKLDESCPQCGKPLVVRYGRFGKFIACSGFPECKFTKNIIKTPLNLKCPKCKDGDVVEKRTRRKRIFYGCSQYPNCNFATWQKPTGELCPECGNALVQMKDYVKCSKKECGFKK